MDTWRYRFYNQSNLNPPINYTAPTPLFVYRETSTSARRELNGAGSVAAGALLSTESSTFGYDFYGNLTGSTVTNLDAVSATVRSVASSFVYGDNVTTWLLGRMTSSTITTSRPGKPAVVRKASFAYEPTTGLLTEEHVVPNSGTASAKLSTYYEYDRVGGAIQFGNRVKTITCSGIVPTATCLATTGANVVFRPTDPHWVQRYSRAEYDSLGRFVNKTYQPYWTGVGTTAVERLSSEVTARNALGDALAIKDANGVATQYAYGALGRKYFEKSAVGAWSETWFRSCASGCVAGAAFEEKKVASGAPTRWTYFDVLGRPFVVVTQGFESNQFSAVRSYFDVVGRAVYASEPHFVVGPGSSAFTLASGSVLYGTMSQYDDLHRAVQSTAANGAVTTIVFDGLKTTSTLPANWSGQIQVKIVEYNVLGEITTTRDGNAGSQFVTSYDYQATGELLTVSRTVDGASTVTTMGYDERGRKTSMSDPDMGSWAYVVNALGETVKQQSPAIRATCTESLYDGLGRIFQRRDVDSSVANTTQYCSGTEKFKSLFDHDTRSQGIGALAKDTALVNGVALQVRYFYYDGFGRPNLSCPGFPGHQVKVDHEPGGTRWEGDRSLRSSSVRRFGW